MPRIDVCTPRDVQSTQNIPMRDVRATSCRAGFARGNCPCGTGGWFGVSGELICGASTGFGAHDEWRAPLCARIGTTHAGAGPEVPCRQRLLSQRAMWSVFSRQLSILIRWRHLHRSSFCMCFFCVVHSVLPLPVATSEVTEPGSQPPLLPPPQSPVSSSRSHPVRKNIQKSGTCATAPQGATRSPALRTKWHPSSSAAQ